MAVKKKKRLAWGWWVLIVALLGGGGYFGWQHRPNAGKPDEMPKGLQVGMAERGDLDQKITATGVVAAQTGAKVNIGSQITGRIRSLPADVGALVAKNQVVAVLDAPDLEAQVEQQRRNVEVTRATLDQAIPRLEQARLNLSLSTDQTQAQISEANSALRAAQSRLESSEAAAKMQPAQTTAEINRTEAALATARSNERQVKQSVAQQLLQAQSSIDDARAGLRNAERQRRRQEALLTEGFISRQEVENVRTQVEQSTARVQNAEASLRIVKEQTEADLQNAANQITQAQAALSSARAAQEQVTIRTADVRTSREVIHQAEATLDLRKTSKTQDRIRRSAYVEAQAAVKQAKASLLQAEALLQFQQAQLDKAVIRSPIAGTVLTINTQQGETVVAGFQVQTLIAVADLHRLEVRAYVDETDIGRIRRGLPVEVRVQSYQARVFKGRVTKIASASTVKDNIVTYETTVAIEDPQGLLRPDMTADVSVILGRRPNVLRVPSEAVHRDVTRTLVYVLHRDKKDKERAEMREVKLGFSDGIYTEIHSGLKEKEEVILAGLPRLGVQAIDAQTENPERKKK
jgi:RND family efflux transporter MFP subunit